MDYTTTAILNRIKKNAAVPSRQPAFDNTELLRFVNDEMSGVVVPLIMQSMEDYFVTYYDYTIATGTNYYRIPSDALNAKLKDLQIISASDATDILNVPYIGITRRMDYQSDNGFYIEGNRVFLIDPEEYDGDTLRMYYFSRPGELVLTSAGACITTYTSATRTCAFASRPSSWADGTVVDVVQSQPPFDRLVESATVSSIGTTSLVISTGSTEIVSGDYITKHGEAVVPQIPAEMFQLLCQSTILKVLEALGDAEGLQLAASKYKQLEQNGRELLTSRVQGEAKIIIPRHGLL